MYIISSGTEGQRVCVWDALSQILHVVVCLQLRELHVEVEELQSSRVQEDVISRAEGRVKELENSLRAEERSVPSQLYQSSSAAPVCSQTGLKKIKSAVL